VLASPVLPAGAGSMLPAVAPVLPPGLSGGCCEGWDGAAPAATARGDADAAEPTDWALAVASHGDDACSRSTISAASGRCAT
jgi:hypothetical protein